MFSFEVNLVFLVVGIVLGTLGGVAAARAKNVFKKAQNCSERVPAEILDVVETTGGISHRLQYEFGGKTRTVRYTTAKALGKTGEKVTLFVDPADPKHVSSDTGDGMSFGAGAVILFGLAAACLMVFAVGTITILK